MRWHKTRVLAAALASLLAIAAVTGACGGGSDNTAAAPAYASQDNVDDLTARTQRNEMLFALVTIEALKLHEIDDSIQAGTPLERAVPDVRKFVRVMALTAWAPDLKADAQAVQDSGVALLKALDAGDLEAAKGPSDEAHDGFHEFADKAWNVVVKDLPPEQGGPDEHEDESTPAAGATPAAEGTPNG